MGKSFELLRLGLSAEDAQRGVPRAARGVGDASSAAGAAGVASGGAAVSLACPKNGVTSNEPSLLSFYYPLSFIPQQNALGLPVRGRCRRLESELRSGQRSITSQWCAPCASPALVASTRAGISDLFSSAFQCAFHIFLNLTFTKLTIYLNLTMFLFCLPLSSPSLLLGTFLSFSELVRIVKSLLLSPFILAS